MRDAGAAWALREPASTILLETHRPPVLQPRALAQPYTATLCLFPYTACSWQLLFPSPCTIVCAYPRDLHLHANNIATSPQTLSNLPLAWPTRFTPRCSPILLVHHLLKLSIIAQQYHSLQRTVIMIQRYKATQGYLASHSVHQTPEHYKKMSQI